MSKLQHEIDQKSERFSTTGFIIAAIGSSVGLGNMWKFPYITGENGGAAFFFLFIVCLIVIGLPVLLAELAIGRSARGSAASSFERAGGGSFWKSAGILQVVAPTLILTFYIIVAGWTLYYSVIAFNGNLFSGIAFDQQFSQFTDGFTSIYWQFAAMVISAFVVILGVAKGIERFNKIIIPCLIALLILLMIRSVTLPGASSGVSFFLSPDFSQLTAESAIVALGHAFFSLSLGMGIMLTYGSYVRKEQSLGTATVAIALGDLIYAFIAGLIIFPTTFSFGIAPDQGPSLVFIALPAAFSAMPFGTVIAGLFFVLLAFAALTSAVSLLEVPVSYIMERLKWTRTKSVIMISIIIFVLGIPSALSFGFPQLTFGGKSFFDWVDFVTANIMLPLGGLASIIFAGFRWKNAAEATGLSARWFKVWLFMIRFIAPILMLLVFLHTTGLLNFSK